MVLLHQLPTLRRLSTPCHCVLYLAVDKFNYWTGVTVLMDLLVLGFISEDLNN